MSLNMWLEWMVSANINYLFYSYIKKKRNAWKNFNINIKYNNFTYDNKSDL